MQGPRNWIVLLLRNGVDFQTIHEVNHLMSTHGPSIVQEEEGKDEAEEEENGRDGVKRILAEVNCWSSQFSES